MTLEPLFDYVLVRLRDGEQKKGLLVIPESAQNRFQGEVVACGPGKLSPEGKVIPLSVKAGDVVLLQRYDTQDVPYHEEKLKLVREGDLLGVFR